MAPSSRTSNYYCELYDKTLVSNANLEEYKVGAIHSGLLEASGKMTKCQLQVFREDLKVGGRKQKLLAKRAIWRLYESRWNLAIGAFLFFCHLCFIGFFFLFIGFFFFCLVPHDSVCDQKLHRPTFSPSCVGTRA